MVQERQNTRLDAHLLALEVLHNLFCRYGFFNCRRTCRTFRICPPPPHLAIFPPSGALCWCFPPILSYKGHAIICWKISCSTWPRQIGQWWWRYFDGGVGHNGDSVSGDGGCADGNGWWWCWWWWWLWCWCHHSHHTITVEIINSTIALATLLFPSSMPLSSLPSISPLSTPSLPHPVEMAVMTMVWMEMGSEDGVEDRRKKERRRRGTVRWWLARDGDKMSGLLYVLCCACCVMCCVMYVLLSIIVMCCCYVLSVVCCGSMLPC